jgi:hypothetical protein
MTFIILPPAGLLDVNISSQLDILFSIKLFNLF